jgi:hypothetical protein
LVELNVYLVLLYLFGIKKTLVGRNTGSVGTIPPEAGRIPGKVGRNNHPDPSERLFFDGSSAEKARLYAYVVLGKSDP